MKKRHNDMKNTICDPAFYETPTGSESIFEGRVLHLWVDSVRLPDGSAAVREVIRHKGAVCVLPLTDGGEVICVRQYRHAVGKMMLELPAGKLDSADEDPTLAARRELREETGATCDSLTSLGVMYGSPAILDEAIHIYLAEGLHMGDSCPDEGELIETVTLPLSELCGMILRGEITDAKTQIAVMKLCLMKNGESLAK